MKRNQILAMLMLVSAILIFINASGDIGTYYTFEMAQQATNPVKVNGTLDPEFEIKYDPAENANLFSFQMLDKDGASNQVIMTAAMPQDFERSEEVVVTGNFKDGTFVATEILTKCPSKYKDEELYIRSEG